MGLDVLNIRTLKMNSKYRIAIIYLHLNLDTCPSICATIECLLEYGYFVDIFTRSSKKYKPFIIHSNKIQVFSSKVIGEFIPDNKFTRLRYLPFFKTVLKPFKSIIKKLISEEALVPQIEKIKQLHSEKPYKAVIGVDPEGFKIAGDIADSLNINLIYWSLELLLTKELTDKYWIDLKECEKKLSQRASFIIIQDKKRSKLLALDNNIPQDKFLFIPNAPKGFYRKQNSNYWHKYFKLDKNTRIVLHSGSIGNWTGVKDIIRSVDDWPKNWIFVIHTSFNSNQDSNLKELYDIATSDRIFFSTEGVSSLKYPELVASADIGIAFYVPEQPPYTLENIHTIGFSSGKISYYLRAGLPVLINQWPDVSKFIQNQKCGIAVNNADEISKAISIIEKKYNEYRNNAYEAFKKYLEPTSYIKKFVKKVDML